MTMQEVLCRFDHDLAKYMEHFDIQIAARERTVETKEAYAKRIQRFRRFFISLHARDAEVEFPGEDDLWEYRKSLDERGLANSSKSNELLAVTMFLKFSEKLEADLPTTRLLPSLRKERRDPYESFLTDDEVKLLWKNERPAGTEAQATTWPRNYAMVVLMLSTKIRVSEIAELCPRDIDLEYMEIRVHGKGDKYRYVEYPEIARTAVDLYLASGYRPATATDDDPLFGSTRVRVGAVATEEGTEPWRPMSDRAIERMVESHVRNVTVHAGLSPHKLRHIGARLDLNTGASPLELQRDLGHASFRTTQLYASKLGTARVKASADRVYKERDRQARRNQERLDLDRTMA